MRIEASTSVWAQPISARVAELFLLCFPESVRDMFGDRPPRTEAMADFFAFIVRTEPEAVQLARTGPGNEAVQLAGTGPGKTGDWSDVVGYAITLRSMPRIWALAARTFAWLPWLARFLTGRYGLSLAALPRILRGKMVFARSFRPADEVEAQVLSVAVDPAWCGRGVGRALLERGLGYLRCQNVQRVKLEVLDDNLSAFHLYESLGFRPVGEAPAGSKRWIIMIRELEAILPAGARPRLP